jgi:hypothetical protein
MASDHLPRPTSDLSFLWATLAAEVAAAEQRLAHERRLELSFLLRLKKEPERLGLQSGADVHGDRRLEAQLAVERLRRRLDLAEAARLAGAAARLSRPEPPGLLLGGWQQQR